MRNKKIDNIFFMIIGTISFYYYYSTLVTTYLYYIIILLLAFLTIFVVKNANSKLKGFTLLMRMLKLFLILYFVLFSFLLIRKNNSKLEIFKTSLNGYYTGRIDGVMFKFKGFSFKRNVNLTDYTQGDLREKYDLKLELTSLTSNIYFIENLSLVEKNNAFGKDSKRELLR